MLQEIRETSPQVTNFFDLTLPDLEHYLLGLGKEKYRAQQLYRWIYGLLERDFDKMTNLAKSFRADLRGLLDFQLPRVLQRMVSHDGTIKYLFAVGEGLSVEAVLIPSKDRLTLCVSSEVGCNMACRFCYTAKQKLRRRLSAGEIVGQFYHVALELAQAGRRVTNVVFMGMGEPLDNPEAVFKAVEILHSQWGFNFSRRRITVSTSGLVPQIPLVSQAGVRLAVSLNATTDEIRSQVMPINKKYPLRSLLRACREYTEQTGDRVTFEYVLLKGVTDSLEDARRLSQIAKSIPSKVNLIAFNEHPGTDYHRPDDSVVLRFQNELIKRGVHVLLRRTMGRDIYAACGQLTSLYEGRPEQLATAILT